MNEEELTNKIDSMEERVTDVEEVIRGSLHGEPGLMQLTKGLVKDMYNEQNGALSRLAKLETESIQFKGAAWGAGWVFKLLWIAFGALVILAMQKLFKL